jgi:hypothetical protein
MSEDHEKRGFEKLRGPIELADNATLQAVTLVAPYP